MSDLDARVSALTTLVRDLTRPGVEPDALEYALRAALQKPALHEPVSDRKALESSCKFIEQNIATRRCDSPAVSDCWRCNSAYLAKRMRELLTTFDMQDRRQTQARRSAARRESHHSTCKGVLMTTGFQAWRKRFIEDHQGIEPSSADAWNAASLAAQPRVAVPAIPEGMALKPIELTIIRKWPEGFQDRLQHVWLDVVSFIPNVKLYDLQRTLAEFGFRMEVYEVAAPHPPAGQQDGGDGPKMVAATYRCIKPHCPASCDGCNHAIPYEPSAKLLIVELLNAFANDGHGATFEDGDCAIVDKARAFLAATASEATAAQQDGWMPIETAPKDGTMFLGYRNGQMREACFVPRDDCEMWRFGGASGAYEYFPEVRPTHWMPLPPAPANGEGAG